MTFSKLPRTLVLASIIALALASLLLHPHDITTHARSFIMPAHMRSVWTAAAARNSPNAFSTAAGDHSYIRPPATETSGFPNNTKANHRSPCPCLNTLANHGYIPRDGKNLTPQLVQDAVVHVFNLEPSLVAKLVAPLPSTFTLADLGEHNFIEHDASLVHDDAFFGTDPSRVNSTLVDDLLVRAVSGSDGNKEPVVTARVLAHFRADRERTCSKNDPQYDFGLKRQGAAYAEAAALLLAMGDYASETISVAHARSFLEHERIPDDFVQSKTQISTTTAVALAAKIKFLALWPWATGA